MCVDKVLIWGIGRDYQKICNSLRWNEDVGNIEILAYISRDYIGNTFDKKMVIRPEQIMVMYGGEFNYIIVSTEESYQEIITYGSEVLGINRNIFLHGRIFMIPCFDWKRYITIYKSNISIVADFCYGGVLSYHLGLPFCSPFVNVMVGDISGYQRLINRMDYYMSMAPIIKEMNVNRSANQIIRAGHVEYPVLWYDDIALHGFHYKNEEVFLSKWEQRRKRYNPESSIIFKIIYDENDLEDFDRLAVDHKIGFYYEKTDKENIITLTFDTQYYLYFFAQCVNKFIEPGDIFHRIDIFRLLLGEEDFKR